MNQKEIAELLAIITRAKHMAYMLNQHLTKHLLAVAELQVTEQLKAMNESRPE